MPIPFESKEFLDSQQWRIKTNSQLLEVSSCISCWTDICGFGSLLEKNKWDLKNLQNDGILVLLNEVYTIAGRPILVNIDPFPNDKIIILNDGIARTIDLTHKDKLHSYTFLLYLRDLIINHYLLLGVTKVYNVGVRTILAGGERIQYSPILITGKSALFYDEKKVSEFGKKFMDTTFVYNPAEFQMNTAFAKAFSIDALGTDNNIKVNGLYIENDFIKRIEGINNIEIENDGKHIKFFFNGVLVFELYIIDTLTHRIKGLDVLIYHIQKCIIYKELDGEDLEFILF